MFKFNFIFVLIIIGIIVNVLISGCKTDQSDQIAGKNTEEVVAILNEFLKDTNYFKSGEDIANIRSLVDGYKSYHDYNKFVSDLVLDIKIDTDTIPNTLARDFHTEYIERRGVPTLERPSPLPANNPLKGDSTLSIVFDFPKILAAMDTVYHPTSWTDTLLWKDRGFLVYLINYGSKGSDGSGKDSFRTSTVIQLAERVNGDWQPKSPYRAFDFGDLKPPKVVDGVSIVENPK